MSETKSEAYLLGDGVDCKAVHAIVRIVGTREYELKYHELNGDEYERILYDARDRAGTDESKRQKFLSELIRAKMLVSVAGTDYTVALDRKMPVWLLADVNEFIIGYISGNM